MVLRPRWGPHRSKNRQKWHFEGPVCQTGSRNMAATRKINFLTLVSYLTLNTFGVYLAPLRLCSGVTLPLAHCKRPQNPENILSPTKSRNKFAKFDWTFLGLFSSEFRQIFRFVVGLRGCHWQKLVENIWITPDNWGQSTPKTSNFKKFQTPISPPNGGRFPHLKKGSPGCNKNGLMGVPPPKEANQKSAMPPQFSNLILGGL